MVDMRLPPSFTDEEIPVALEARRRMRNLLWAQCAVKGHGHDHRPPCVGRHLVHVRPARSQDTAWIAAGLGLIEAPVGLLIAPYVLRLHARITHSPPAPTAKDG
ncbi:hypothetical protein [Streptomyces sp. NBC_01456]|uniref:hypothetical protein n=1 Tax=unclassified Streptomyces TaxID=2593676 RepID=UPI003FCEAF1C